MTGTQFLQVPKPLPHRRARSRSKSRPQEVVEVQEVRIFPSKERPKSFPSPPSPQLSVKSMTTTVETRHNEYKWSLPSEKAHEIKLDSTNGYTKDVPNPIAAVPSPVLAPSPPPKPVDLNGEMYTLESINAPAPEPSLRQKIIGAWKLESYVAHPTPGSTIQRPTYPMTKNVTGFIMYTPDGYMSAQMLIPGQQSFKRGQGEEPQWAEAAKRCFAYCGPYYITDEGPGREEVLRHTFQVCNLPGWIGDIQVRTHRFEEDGQVLVLGSEEPSEIKGDKRIPVLKWRRARDNADSAPPPPTPQIKISGPAEH